MNVEKINLVKIANNLHCAKTPKSKVFLPIELEDNMYNNIQKELPRLEKYADIIGKPMIFVPKGNATLMNFGPKTTVLDNNATQSQIALKMYAHVNEVNALMNPKSIAK